MGKMNISNSSTKRARLALYKNLTEKRKCLEMEHKQSKNSLILEEISDIRNQIDELLKEAEKRLGLHSKLIRNQGPKQLKCLQEDCVKSRHR